ncbi:hypothetical protein HPG69_003890 [Diceros bicornis minor]|uniref:DUF4482 domain-containing protein n=1 Tax=Diceros bicornis minor TaxID=77932 RepID=A0A7J7ETX3_DICBM|nr:hypothetical protein HPG69_003890 [Diceros bicornis minor]
MLHPQQGISCRALWGSRTASLGSMPQGCLGKPHGLCDTAAVHIRARGLNACSQLQPCLVGAGKPLPSLCSVPVLSPWLYFLLLYYFIRLGRKALGDKATSAAGVERDEKRSLCPLCVSPTSGDGVYLVLAPACDPSVTECHLDLFQSSLKRRGSRETYKEKKTLNQVLERTKALLGYQLPELGASSNSRDAMSLEYPSGRPGHVNSGNAKDELFSSNPNLYSPNLILESTNHREIKSCHPTAGCFDPPGLRAENSRGCPSRVCARFPSACSVIEKGVSVQQSGGTEHLGNCRSATKTQRKLAPRRKEQEDFWIFYQSSATDCRPLPRPSAEAPGSPRLGLGPFHVYLKALTEIDVLCLYVCWGRGAREIIENRNIWYFQITLSRAVLSWQDDSADLKCQLQFAKEEGSLMCKKMAKLGREKDELEQELQKYKALYGDVDSPLPTGEAGGPPSTREAELKLRLKLVEEEANILGRKIVELEVENRGLKAEMEDLRGQCEREGPGRDHIPSIPTSPFGDSLESSAELRRHLQFVEEEAELLRRSISEIEDHNRQLTHELSKFKFEPRPEPGWLAEKGAGAGAPLQEELKSARLQINELSGKVLKLQYENRVLLSNVQRYDLAAHLGLRAPSPRDSDADSDAGKKESDGEEGRPPQPRREGPIGGESDSEEMFEKSSGFGSGKPSEASEPCAAALLRAREDSECLVSMRREAERLERTVERLISDTEGFAAGAGLQGGQGHGDTGQGDQNEPQLLGTINARMKAFRKELQAFLEQVHRLGDGLRERLEGLSPLPHLTESSSFLSTVTSVSRDSPVGTLGKELVPDLQSKLRDQMEWQLGQERGDEPEHLRLRATWELHRRADGDVGSCRPGGQSCVNLEVSKLTGPTGQTPSLPPAPPFVVWLALRGPPVLPEQSVSIEELQGHLAQATRLHQEETEKFTNRIHKMEEEHLYALRWKELEMHSLALQNTLHERTWSDERNLMQQELRSLKQNIFLFYIRLRWLLKHWRQGKQAEEEGEDFTKSEHPETLPRLGELGVLEDPTGGGPDQDDDGPGCSFAMGEHSSHSPVQIGDHGSRLQPADGGQFHRQVVENQQLFGALKTLLEDLRLELQEDEHARLRLQQQYASDKAAWDVEWAMLKCRLEQLEEKTEKNLGEPGTSADSKGAFKKERETHQKLLADSHSLVMDLRWQIHHSEKNWNREKVELLDCLDRERQEWERQKKELLWRLEQLQKENSPRRGGIFLCDQKEGNIRPCAHPGSPHVPRTLGMWPCVDTDSTPFEDRPLSKLKESDRCSARENLYLDALSLDDEPEEPPAHGPQREFRNCLPEEEENPKGNLQRAVSVSSMSEFQRLMDVSPFLPEKGLPAGSSREDVTPPLSPDDLKYIEEFNSKSWDERPPDPWADRTEGGQVGHEAGTEPFPDSSWYLTTSVTMTTDTMTSPEHCLKQPLRSHVRAEPPGVRVLHSPPAVRRMDSIVVAGGEGRGRPEPECPFSTSRARGGTGDTKGGSSEHMLGRWPGAPSRHPRDYVEGGLRPLDSTLCTPLGFASPLHSLEMSKNMSDDMKEVAFSVRNAICSGPTEPPVKDMACQTNGSRTTGTQTVQTISVGLQTEALRGSAITSSPHKCLTPKAGGGATPASSPSRGLRSRQVAPAIEKVQAKFERTCCSPKYGSPKLQRKPFPKADQPNNRTSPGLAQKGCSESAWARSTTTRESPVHTAINDGLSSLFNIIDHSPVVQDPFQKGMRAGSRSCSAEPRPELGLGQETSPSSRGQSPSPIGVGSETCREEGGEGTPVRQDLSAPPGYTLTENVARILNKKLLEHALKEERRQSPHVPSSLNSDSHVGEAVKAEPGSIEELPCSALAPSLEPCFSRPERPANRRPPSRWAPHSPMACPAQSPGDLTSVEELGDEEAPGEKLHL